jgi:predicted TIM-barrel fold metal-dependent hydrolase
MTQAGTFTRVADPSMYRPHEMNPPITYFDAWTRIGATLAGHPELPHNREALVGEMRLCHVANALVSFNDQKWWDPALANRRILEDMPDFLSPLWTVVPGDGGDFPTGDKLQMALMQARVPAVQILPKTHEWNPRGKAAGYLLDLLAEGGWPVFISLGEEVTPAEMEDLAGRYPRVRWVAVNGGWFEQRAIAGLLAHTSNVSLTLHRYHSNFGIEHLVENGHGGRLLFSSNAPATSMGASRAYVDWAGIPDEAKRGIAGENLRRLLKFLPSGVLEEFDPPDSLIQDAMNGSPLQCGAIDFHSHILEDGVHTGGLPVMLHGDAAGIKRMADSIGISQIGVMSWVGIQSKRQDEGHLPVIKAVENDPDRFWGLATIQVERKSDEQKTAELDAVVSGRRILGIKPYPTFGLAYDDPQYAAIWRYAEENGLYAGIHPFHWYQPDEFVSLCTRYPKLKVVAYHAGCTYEIADTVITLCRKFPNLYAEINYSSVTGGIIKYLVEGCGEDRVLFGTDQPLRDPRQQLGWVVYSRLSEETKIRILRTNAEQLLASVNRA